MAVSWAQADERAAKNRLKEARDSVMLVLVKLNGLDRVATISMVETAIAEAAEAAAEFNQAVAKAATARQRARAVPF
jgi:hypothetical protein